MREVQETLEMSSTLGKRTVKRRERRAPERGLQPASPHEVRQARGQVGRVGLADGEAA